MDLERISLFDVYIYEKGYGTSKNVIDDYLDEIYDSHLCLFLINSSESIPDGVKKEIDYAVKYNKPKIYIFNHENAVQETPFEKELKTPNGSRIKKVNYFYDFYAEGIESIKSEVVKLYKDYSSGRLIRSEQGEQSSIELNLALTETKLEKSYTKGFEETKEYICSFMGTEPINFEKMISNGLDRHTKNFFEVLIRNKNIEEFNTTFYLDELKGWHSEKVFEIIRFRWKAIEYYYSGELEKCIENLKIAYEKAIDNKVANWLIQDILIDLRNKSHLNNNNKNIVDTKSAPQRLLNQNKEVLTYPVIDRLSKKLMERIEKKRKDDLFTKPHSTTYDNILSEYAGMLTSIYVVAAHYGSLTHLESVINFLKEIYFHLVEMYSNWEFKIMLLKTAAYSTNKKDIERIFREYNSIYTKINSKDVEEIFAFAIKHPNLISSKKNGLLVLSHMGYFLNNKAFKKRVNTIEQDFNIWLEDRDKNVTLGDYFFKFAKENIERLNQDKIVRFANAIYSSSLKRFYDLSLEVLRRVDFNMVGTDGLTILIDHLERVAKNKDVSRHDYLRIVLVELSQVKIKNNVIDDIAVKYLSNFEKEIYYSEVYEDGEKPHGLFVKCLEDLKQSNVQSSVGKIYSKSGYNYFSIIKSTLKQIEDISLDNIKTLLGLLTQIIIHDNQEADAKVDAFQLLIFLKNNDSRFSDQGIYYNEVLENDEYILNTRESFMFNHTSFVISFNYFLYRTNFDKDYNQPEHHFIGEIIDASETEKLDVSKAIRNYLYGNKSEISQLTISLLFILKSDKNEQIRANSILALMYFIKSHWNNNDDIIIEISKMMDNETTLIKNIILRNIKIIEEKNPGIAEYILQKGKIDDHYVIRKQTNSILENGGKGS